MPSSQMSAHIISRNNYFPRMIERVRQLFPEFDERNARHACNKIGNELRRAPYDIHDVRISNKPFDAERGYFTFFNVEAAGRAVYVRVSVD